MKLIDDVFFDLDRTLWDFETNSKTAIKTIYNELNLSDSIESFEDFHEVYRKINAKYWDLYSKGEMSREKLRTTRFIDTLKIFKIYDEKLGDTFGELYIQRSPYQTNLFPGTKETLQTLKNDNYKLHIITNGFKEVQFIKLKNSGIIEYFDDILCSEDVGKNKPDPSIFNAALKRTNAAKSKSIMIGDDFKADVLGAESCGIRGVLFDPNNQYHDKKNVERIVTLDKIPEILVGI